MIHKAPYRPVLLLCTVIICGCLMIGHALFSHTFLKRATSYRILCTNSEVVNCRHSREETLLEQKLHRIAERRFQRSLSSTNASSMKRKSRDEMLVAIAKGTMRFSFGNLHLLYNLMPRPQFNMMLANMLKAYHKEQRGKTTKIVEPEEFLRTVVEQQHHDNMTKLSADTVNAFIKHALQFQRNITRADEIFNRYFCSGAVRPSPRSINVLLEAHRKWSNCEDSHSSTEQSMRTFHRRAMRRYFEYFTAFRLQPDSYSFSAVVRAADSPQQVHYILAMARNFNVSDSVALLRCVVETFGKLGDPSAAVMIAQRMSVEDGIYHSYQSADALIVALLQAPNVVLDFNSSDNKLMMRLHGMSAAAAALDLMESRINELPCSSKGYCALFTHIQREMAADSTSASDGSSKLRRLCSQRDKLWIALKRTVLGTLDEPKRSLVPAAVLVTGTVIDALLRCFLFDVPRARRVWKQEILPLMTLIFGPIPPNPLDLNKMLGTNMSGSGNASNTISNYRIEHGTADVASLDLRHRECIRNGLEALMFLCGRNQRPDLALEVARTVRRYNWWLSTVRPRLRSEPTRTKSCISPYCAIIYRSYCYGKAKYRLSLRSELFSDEGRLPLIPAITDLVNRGIENSIELELGVLPSVDRNKTEKRQLERIRIQFQ